MSQNLPLDSCFKWIFRFSMLKHPWIYFNLFFGFMICHFIFLWIHIQKQASTSWHPKLLVTTLINQDNKVAFIIVDEDGELARSSEFMRTCHNMNIIVQTIVLDASSLNDKSESLNKTIANITRALLLNSSHKKELWCFHISTPYGSPAEVRIDCVVMCFTFYGMEQDFYTNISKYGVWESTSSMDVIQERNWWQIASVHFMGYADTIGVILYC